MNKKNVFLFTGLMLLIVSSISMSLAWFAGARELYIDSINLYVGTEDKDLFISLDNDINHATHSIHNEDFGEIGNFEPVTSMRSYESAWINNASAGGPTFIDSYKSAHTKHPQENIAIDGYFQRTLYLFTEETMYVTLDSENTYVKANQELNDSIAKSRAEKDCERIANSRYTSGMSAAERSQIKDEVKSEFYEQYRTKYLSDLNSIEKSMRISLLDYTNAATKTGNYTIIDPMKEGETVFGGRLNTSSSDPYYDFYTDTDNEVKEIVFGNIIDPSYEPKYLDAPLQDSSIEGPASCFNAKTKAGVHPLDIEDMKAHNPFEIERSLSPDVADVGITKDEMTGFKVKVEPGVAHPVVLSIYIEGWDLDNADWTADGSFDMSVSFKLYREA